jgi:hypothetical protein
MKKMFVLTTIMFSFLYLNAQVKNEKSKQESIHAKASPDSSKMHQIEHRKMTGKCKFCGMPLNLSVKEKMKYEVMHPHSYSCPMHHDQKSAKEGKCPKCGMKMKKTEKHLKEHKEIEKYHE